MFSYPYGYSRYTPPNEYARALAEERAARNQYIAAVRAEEDARRRAAEARARQAYISPYEIPPRSSYLPVEYDDDDLDEDSYLPQASYGYDLFPQRRRALLAERRRRELERARVLEEQRQRQVLEEAHRQRLLEEEAQRQRDVDDSLQGDVDQRQNLLEQIYDSLGLRAPYSDQAQSVSILRSPFTWDLTD